MRTPPSAFVACLGSFAGPLAVVVTAVFGIGVPLMVSALLPSEAPAAVVRPPLDMAMVGQGQQHFWTACVACHGADAKGVPNLGRDLTAGASVHMSDEELAGLIMRGRQPGEKGHTSAVAMPPKGGHDEFTRDDIRTIVAYLRGLQQPSRLTGPMPSLVVAAPADTEPTPPAAAPTTPSGPADASGSTFAFDADAAARGKKVFNSCMACHAKTGLGIPNLGADLIHSSFVSGTDDAELVAFIKRGRLPTDPDSRMRLSMPPKGGNPSLKDEQLGDVVAYIRSLQAAATSK